MTIGKQTAQGVCFMKTTAQFLGSNIKIVPDDNAIKLGCCDRCGPLLNTSERISEQALSCSLKGGDRLDELAAMDFSMIAVALKPSLLV